MKLASSLSPRQSPISCSRINPAGGFIVQPIIVKHFQLFEQEEWSAQKAKIYRTEHFQTGENCTLFERREHRQLREIKSDTYHNLKVEKTPSGYETTIIFDV